MKLTFILAAIGLLSIPAFGADTVTVCPDGSVDAGCDYTGNSALQQAVNAVPTGGTVRLTAGTYNLEGYKDVPFQEHWHCCGAVDVVVRSSVFYEGKDITIIGEGDVALTGDALDGSSAIVVKNGGLHLENITIRGFKRIDDEDDIHDGYGVFVIDSKATLRNVIVHDLPRMALSVRGTSEAHASHMRVFNTHVAFWIKETGHLTVDQTVMQHNDAGFAAYANSVTEVSNAVVDESTSEGVYSAGQAQVTLRNTILMNNKPYGIRALDDSKVHFISGAFYANEADATPVTEKQEVILGEGVFRINP